MNYFKAKQGERNVIGIGLTRKDFQSLLQGEPRWIRGEDVGFEGDILLIAGESDDANSQRVRGNMPVGTLWLPPGAKDN